MNCFESSLQMNYENNHRMDHNLSMHTNNKTVSFFSTGISQTNFRIKFGENEHISLISLLSISHNLAFRHFLTSYGCVQIYKKNFCSLLNCLQESSTFIAVNKGSASALVSPVKLLLNDFIEEPGQLVGSARPGHEGLGVVTVQVNLLGGVLL